MQSLLGRSEAVMQFAAPVELTTLLWACARMQWKPPKSFLSQFMLCSYEALPHCDAQQLAHLIWALAKLNLRFRCDSTCNPH